MDVAHREAVVSFLHFYKSRKDRRSILIGRLLGNWLSTGIIKDFDLYGELRYQNDFSLDIFRQAVVKAEGLIQESLNELDRFPPHLRNLSRDPRSRGMPE